jgi:hypothetical protein
MVLKSYRLEEQGCEGEAESAENKHKSKTYLHKKQKDRHVKMGDESAVEQNQKDSPEKEAMEKSSSVLRRK